MVYSLQAVDEEYLYFTISGQICGNKVTKVVLVVKTGNLHYHNFALSMRSAVSNDNTYATLLDDMIHSLVLPRVEAAKSTNSLRTIYITI